LPNEDEIEKNNLILPGNNIPADTVGDGLKGTKLKIERVNNKKDEIFIFNYNR
jgi:hypothetical protein